MNKNKWPLLASIPLIGGIWATKVFAENPWENVLLALFWATITAIIFGAFRAVLAYRDGVVKPDEWKSTILVSLWAFFLIAILLVVCKLHIVPVYDIATKETVLTTPLYDEISDFILIADGSLVGFGLLILFIFWVVNSIGGSANKALNDAPGEPKKKDGDDKDGGKDKEKKGGGFCGPLFLIFCIILTVGGIILAIGLNGAQEILRSKNSKSGNAKQKKEQLWQGGSGAAENASGTTPDEHYAKTSATDSQEQAAADLNGAPLQEGEAVLGGN